MSLVSKVKRLANFVVNRNPEDEENVVSVSEPLEHVHPKKLLHTGPKFVANYVKSLFPFFQWIGRYNTTWLTGDLIAGLTVGIVLVPQSMSYAKIATLPPEYGLYSSFVGVFVYCFFATAKDVSIGPVAVMSLETSKIIARVQAGHGDRWSAPEIATTTAFICGFIVLGIGLLRVGRVVELIPAPAVSGFMTGSALSILTGQIPGLFGISGLFDTRAPTYEVIINTFKHLHQSTLDAAFGVTGLTVLYLIKWTFQYLTKRYPHRARAFFFVSITRNAFVIIVLTIASWLFTRRRGHMSKGKITYPIQILQTVPRGFQHVGSPTIDPSLLAALGEDLFVATIILLLEHIAIAKSFGRVNGYKINPNQELIAIGVTNTIGTVFGAYPATGSFSRSALKAKSGVRTPAAGWFTGIVVIVALYGLTDAFYWIPNAGLSAIIIHAVADLVASPPQVYKFWRISPLEFVIWWAAVLVTVFSSIENGIYTSIIASLALLVLRIMVPRGQFLGKVTLKGDQDNKPRVIRQVFLPLDSQTDDRSQIKVTAPAPGVVIYRHEDGLLYPNSSEFNVHIVDYIKERTRRGKDMTLVPLKDRPWNDPGPKRGAVVDEAAKEMDKPILRAIVLDFSSVTHVDTTAVQNLVDTRVEVEKWADGPVEFHFANILSPWIRRALVAGGFGIANSHSGERRQPIEVAPVVPPHHPEVFKSEEEEFSEVVAQHKLGDEECGSISTRVREGAETGVEGDCEPVKPLISQSTPYFHFSLASAVAAAEATADSYGTGTVKA